MHGGVVEAASYAGFIAPRPPFESEHRYVAFSTEQHRAYQKKRRIERLAMAVGRLGGCCVRCGSTGELQFDHIIPGSRVRKVSEATNWSMERFLAEVDKCQLLCPGCHIGKSVESNELNSSRKLTEDDVREIRSSGLTVAGIAGKFRISRSTAWKVQTGRTWKHLS